MKRSALLNAVSALVIGVCSTPSGVFAADDYSQIRIATEGAYAPYNFKDSAGNLVGFELDLAQELCQRMQSECEIVEQAWDGIIPALLAGKYDVIMAGMSITEERQQVITFTRPYEVTPIRFVALEASPLAAFQSALDSVTLPDIDTDEQAALDAIGTALDGKIVGVQASTTHENFMREYYPDIELKSYDTMDNMILDLQAGRIDTGFSAVSFLAPLLEKDPDLLLIGPGFTGGPLGQGVGAGIRKEDQALADKISAAIETMIDDGSLSKLAIQWFGFDNAAKK